MIDAADITNARDPRGYGGAAIVFLVAVVARIGFGVYSHQGAGPDSLVYDDEYWYWVLAKAYAAGDGFIGEFGHRAERMPLYPWFLSWFAGFDNGPGLARAAQWGLGALAAPLTYLLARPLCRWPMLAGLAVACDPALAGSTSLLLTETLHVTATVALWWLAWDLLDKHRASAGRWCAVAAMACVCVHLREASLAFVSLLLAFLVVFRRDRGSLVGAVCVVAVTAATLTPWAYRNSTTIGKWCWLTTRGGISLYDGVRPGATGTGDLAGVKDAPEVIALNEVEWDAHFRAMSHRAIREDPARILRLAPVKLARTWSPLLHAAEHTSIFKKAVFAGWFIPLYLLAMVGMWACRRSLRVWGYLLLPAVAVCMLHSVFVGSVRYRLPALPMLAVLAAIGAAGVYERFCKPAKAQEDQR